MARIWCFDDETGIGNMMVRVWANGETGITGLQAYASGSTVDSLTEPGEDPACNTTTSVNGHADIYSLQFNDGDCGSDKGTFIRVLGWPHYLSLHCNKTMPYEVTIKKFSTGPFNDTFYQFVNPYDVKFFAIAADDTNVPLLYVNFLQDIKFRLIYQQGEKDDTQTNMGKIFHVAYTEQDAKNGLVIQIVTASLGTSVVVTGGGGYYNIDVRRDRAVEVAIAKENGETEANNNDWKIETKAVIIMAYNENIGVRVISRGNGAGSSYVALPDKSLGTIYQGLTLDNPAHQDGELVVIPTKATKVTIQFNDYNTAGLVIDDTGVLNTDTKVTKEVNEGEVLHVFCDNACKQLWITAEEKIAVVFGARNKPHKQNNDNGDVMTQLIPMDKFDNHFVVSTPQGYQGQYVIHTGNPDNKFVVFSDDDFVSSTMASFPYIDEQNSEQRFTRNIGYFFHAPGGTNDPSLLPIPSVLQWNRRYYVYMTEGREYKLTFIGKKLLDIEFLTGSANTNLNGTSLNDQGVLTTAVPPLLEDSENWEKLEIMVQVEIDETWEISQGLIEFRSPNPWDTFYLLVFEDNGFYMSSYLPFGVRYTVPFCFGDEMRPADGIDNDCDGYVDEEILNGVDDDNDKRIDEDVAWIQDSDFTGIYVTKMVVGWDDFKFNASLIYDRCSALMYDNDDGGFSFSLDHFTHNSWLAQEFDDLYVIDSGVMNAVRFVDDNVLSVIVYFNFCNGNMTRCEDPCPEAEDRPKRSDDDENLMSAMLRLPIVRDGKKIEKTEEEENYTLNNDIVYHPCLSSPLFWVTVGMSMLIMTVELGATAYFLRMQAQFARAVGY
ncbi:hypothetical protein ACF0H5_013516 [Mactra antiquata]